MDYPSCVSYNRLLLINRRGSLQYSSHSLVHHHLSQSLQLAVELAHVLFDLSLSLQPLFYALDSQFHLVPYGYAVGEFLLEDALYVVQLTSILNESYME